MVEALPDEQCALFEMQENFEDRASAAHGFVEGVLEPSLGSRRPCVVSLFSGCGGLDLGFQLSGFQISFAADNDPAAVAAYNGNLGGEARVLDVLDSKFDSELRAISSCDVLLGGFPCQGFSKAGPKRQSDSRNTLYQAMITALGILRPRIFIAENVDGLAQNYNGRFLQQIVRDCADVGYDVTWRIVDAAWFGVPQHRRRILIVGLRTDAELCPFVWPRATFQWVTRNGERAVHASYPNWSPHLRRPRTVADSLIPLSNNVPDHEPWVPVSARDRAILDCVPQGGKLCNARHDEVSVRTWDVPKAFGQTSAREKAILESLVRNRRHKRYGSVPNGNPLSLEILKSVFDPSLSEDELDSLVARRWLKRVGEKWDVRGAMFASGLYKRPRLNRPSPTVLTVFSNPRYFAHPTEPRPFTVREVARLQTFPDSFEFARHGVGRDDAYRLIGNAVPPLLAKALAMCVLDTLQARSDVEVMKEADTQRVAACM